MNQEAGTANQTGDAQAYLDNAFAAFNSKDYVKAVENARIARAKYYNLNPNDPQIGRLATLINSSMEAIGFQADSYLQNATAYSESKDYTNALEYAKKAADAYAFIKYDAGLSKSQAIINASKQALGVTADTIQEQQSSRPTLDVSSLLPILIGLIIIIIVVLIAILALKKQKGQKKNVI